MNGKREMGKGKTFGGAFLKSIFLTVTLLPLPFYLMSCKSLKHPTYKSEFVAQEMRKLCLHDYKMTVEARRDGNTLQAFFWRVGLLRPGELEMQPEAAESLERVL